MTADDVKVFLPLLTVFLSPVIGGLAWAAKHFVNQINTKDAQLAKSAEANTQLAVNTTRALEQFTESNRAMVEQGKEMNRLLVLLTEQQKDTTRSVTGLEDAMDRFRQPK
jgi:methyl-accepting chemotaxis protein